MQRLFNVTQHTTLRQLSFRGSNRLGAAHWSAGAELLPRRCYILEKQMPMGSELKTRYAATCQILNKTTQPALAPLQALQEQELSEDLELIEYLSDALSKENTPVIFVPDSVRDLNHLKDVQLSLEEFRQALERQAVMQLKDLYRESEIEGIAVVKENVVADKPAVASAAPATAATKTKKKADRPKLIKKRAPSILDVKSQLQPLSQALLQPQLKLKLKQESQTLQNLKQETQQKSNQEAKQETQPSAAARRKIVKAAALEATRLANETQIKLARRDSRRKLLRSYLRACVNNEMPEMALSALQYYRYLARKHAGVDGDDGNDYKVFVTEHFNVTLHGFAKNGNYERFPSVLNLMGATSIKYNEQTYAAIFECLGRQPESGVNNALIQEHIEKAANEGYTLHDIMDRSKFVADQRDLVLSALRRVQPDFTPIYILPEPHYDNKLLNQLNDITRADPIVKASFKQSYSAEMLKRLASEQLQVERKGFLSIESVQAFKSATNGDTIDHSKKLAEIEQEWRKQIPIALKRNIDVLRTQMRTLPSGAINMHTYLTALKPDDYCDIIVQEVLKIAEGSISYSPTVNSLYDNLGRKVQLRCNIKRQERDGTLAKLCEVYDAYCDEWEGAGGVENERQTWQRVQHEARQSGASLDVIEPAWPRNMVLSIGRFLYSIIKYDIKLPKDLLSAKYNSNSSSSSKSKKPHKVTKNNISGNKVSAIYTVFRNYDMHEKEEVKPHPALANLVRVAQERTLTFDSNMVPMVCPPKPWSSPHHGGYLLNPTMLVRVSHYAMQQWERIKACEPQQLYPVLDSLNQLGSVPWRVNTEILDIVLDVFRRGGDSQLDVPMPPEALLPPNATKMSAKERLAHQRDQSEMYSLWCDALYRLSLANHYRNKVFWLPHTVDFRGRTYPVPPHLHHLAGDLSRSLLIFDEARPLGPDGFTQLKLHCINLTGLKKRCALEERIEYAEQVLDDILDSADRPLDGRRWWTQSEDPWQTLACCIEIAKVQRCADPAAYLSRFPIHQDGSCNGLQHYAALGRDRAGAVSVNLAPSKSPRDVYSDVVDLVEQARAEDARNGNKIAQLLAGHIKRKVIKQTVMTTVYNVTRFGAVLQIERQLKDNDQIPAKEVRQAAGYLATTTFSSLAHMFTSTRQIQSWFIECARLISNVHRQKVEWVTPLGLPVVQPYSKRKSAASTLDRHGSVAANEIVDMYEKPDTLKQKNAFPPNFVHSLDSSHMMLTSLHCARHGITFVSVHDCFWTHARHVPEMNRICREQFVALHSQPILEDLLHFMCEHYGLLTTTDVSKSKPKQEEIELLENVLKIPEKGEFDINEVLKSIYFFS